jgi:hypothetical protein
MARPEYEPTEKDRATVQTMTAYGVPQGEISVVLGVDPKTLRKHFRFELDTAAAQANARVAAALYKKATGDGPGSIAAAIFWLRARAGWSAAGADEMGKKEQRQSAAEEHGQSGKYAPPAPPALYN